MAPDLKKWWVKAILTIGNGWLVNLAKWAIITISELSWLKLGMGVPNGP
jgi:hypothetical protein